MKVTEGYKVVRRTRISGREGYFLMSCFASEIAAVEYAIGKRTDRVKGNGPLAVFKSRSDAIQFADQNFYISPSDGCKLRVYKCNYEPVSQEADPELKLWYKGHFGGIIPSFALPSGTRLANWVELLGEIPWSPT